LHRRSASRIILPAFSFADLKICKNKWRQSFSKSERRFSWLLLRCC
jgi:hypothetical protein